MTSAQNYSIRVTSNTNLRAAASLQASIVETVPAGTTLNVVGSADRWLRIDRMGTRETDPFENEMTAEGGIYHA